MRIAELPRRIWYLFHRSRLERELQQEMQAHREMMGEPVRFGNMLRLREESRDVWGWNWLDGLYRDVRYGIRGLRREPTFALTAVLTLALGLATTTTVFSIVDSELWKPLPFPDPEQLVEVYSRRPGKNGLVDPISGKDLLEWRAAAPAFSSIAAAGGTSRQILQLDTAQSVLLTEVTSNYFATLGREPIAGAIPGAGEIHGVSPAVLTDRAWTRWFGADPSIVGRSVILNGKAAVVFGIVRSDDSLGPDCDMYILLDESAPEFANGNGPAFWGAIGRLRAGSGRDVARTQLQAVETRLARRSNRDNGRLVDVVDLREYFTGSNWRPLYFFLGASIVVLLLSVVNVATLLLARAIRRTREFALRGALGGGLAALLRHLLVEGGLVAILSAFIGVAMTVWAVGLFVSQLPSDFLLRGANIPIDYRVYGFALGVAVLITLAFAVAPLMLLRRFDLASALGNGARSGSSASEGRARGLLLKAQIAMTVLLLSGAGLFLKSFVALTAVPLGFDPTNTLVVRSSLSGPRYDTDDAIRGYANRVLASAESKNGIRSAAIASSSPLGSGPLVLFAAAEATLNDAPGRAILRSVGPGFFHTLNIRLLQGREFSSSDVAGGPRVAIVNESLAHQLFGETPAVGRNLELLPGARVPWTKRPGTLLIVGVASNVKDVGVNEIEFPDIYVPFDQAPAPWVELVVRTDTPVARVGSLLTSEVARIDPAVLVLPSAAYVDRVSKALQGDRFNAVLVSGFAAVALALASIGIYGAVAYNVQARTRELGVRLALGAKPAGLVRSTLWQAGRFAVVGGAIGIAGVLALAGLMGDAVYLVAGSHNGLLYGVTTTDPAVLGVAFVGIVGVALAAGSIPARRVARVDPASVLRAD